MHLRLQKGQYLQTGFSIHFPLSLNDYKQVKKKAKAQTNKWTNK